MLRFTEKVNQKPAVLDELKQWVAENKMEKPEWVEPVIIFDKEKLQTGKRKRSRPRSGVRKMNLVIGVEDDKKKEHHEEKKEA